MNKIRISALGDSITKGVVLGGEGGYSVLDNSFVELLRADERYEIDNYGKFGCTISNGHNVINHHADEIASSRYTLLEYGGNDCDFHWKRVAMDPTAQHTPKTPLEAFKESFVALIDKIKALGSQPIILSLPPIDSGSYFNFFSRTMNKEQRDNILEWMGEVEAIERWHESYNKALFDIATATTTPIMNITKAFSTHRSDLICSDGIHPNAAGHNLIAQAITQAGLLV